MSTQSKKVMISGALALFVSLGVLVSGCEPKPGDPGPQGEAGAQGPKGDAGAQGPKGDAGTANVIYSPWTSVSFTGSGSSYIGNLTAVKITQEVLDKADIRVYWNESGRILSLPYSETLGSVTYTVHQRFYVGRIELKASYALINQQMRYVIIPGGVASGRLAALDLSNYEAVKKAFNLPD